MKQQESKPIARGEDSAQTDVQFADDVLAACIADEKFRAEAMPMLTPEIMPTESHAFVVEVFRDCFDAHGEAPSFALIAEACLSKFKSRKDRSIAAKELWGRLEAHKARAPRTSLDKIREFANLQGSVLRWEEAGELLKKGDLAAADEIFRKGVMQSDSMSDYVLSRWLEEFEKRQMVRLYERDHPDESPHVQTHFPNLDLVINGGYGLREAQVGGILAVTNRGKTILAINWGFNAMMQGGKKVAHISCEMTQMEVDTRYDSRFTGQAADKFPQYKFDAEEIMLIDAMLAEAREKCRGKLRTIAMPLDDCSREKVEKSLEHARQDMEGLDLVIFDSCDHVRSKRQSFGKDSYRLEQAANYWWFKTLAQRDRFAGWSTIQAGSQAAGGRATNEDVSEAYDKARHLDVIVSLNAQSKKSRATPKDDVGEDAYAEGAEVFVGGSGLSLFVAKNRHGPALLDIPLRPELHRMLICDGGSVEDAWTRNGPRKAS